MSKKPSTNPSIEHELHLQEGAEASVPTEPLETPITPFVQEEDAVDHTVWDEPTLVAQSSGTTAPEGQLTYERWLTAGIANTTWVESFAITFLLILAAGPWGVLGAFAAGAVGAETTMYGILTVAVLAPITEEITKVAAALWVIEKRPYWFKSMWQILACAAAGGMMFGVIENLIYIYVYHPDGGDDFAAWRWSVCMGLHINCSVLAGFGLVRIWGNAIRERRRPELGLGMPFFAMAMVAHGLYNFSVTIAEVTGLLTFE